MPRSSTVDGELQMLRNLCGEIPAEERRSRAIAGSAKPIATAGALPFPPALTDELVSRAGDIGVDEDTVRDWLRPMPARIDSDTPPWSDAFSAAFAEARAHLDLSESREALAARIATTLEGAATTNDEESFTAYFRAPKQKARLEYPLLLLMNVTWLIEILDEQRRELVAECRARDRSWADIALALGVTRASAWQRYSDPDE